MAVQGVKGDIEAHQTGARFFQEKCADAVVDQSRIHYVIALSI